MIGKLAIAGALLAIPVLVVASPGFCDGWCTLTSPSSGDPEEAELNRAIDESPKCEFEEVERPRKDGTSATSYKAHCPEWQPPEG